MKDISDRCALCGTPIKDCGIVLTYQSVDDYPTINLCADCVCVAHQDIERELRNAATGIKKHVVKS